MWLRICRCPDRPVEGVNLGQFQLGGIVDLGPQLTAVFLAERWARPVYVRIQRDIAASAPDRLLLVVDDDPSERTLLRDLCNEYGYAVVVAENGKEGLEQLSDYTPDLILLDLEMPVMDGWRFRAEQTHLANMRLASIPVVLVTGTRNANQSAHKLQAAGLVEKPFDPEGLIGAVWKALATARQPASLDRRVRM
jgi:CheY-like chemotaxis protein